MARPNTRHLFDAADHAALAAARKAERATAALIVCAAGPLTTAQVLERNESGLSTLKVSIGWASARPNDGKALEPVLGRAQAAGIKVIMNESPKQKNADWDVELIQDEAFGEAHLEAFADAIGGEGKYVVYVGGLTVTLHNLWADYAAALQKQKYPKMQQVGDRFGVSNSVDDSYNTKGSAG